MVKSQQVYDTPGGKLHGKFIFISGNKKTLKFFEILLGSLKYL